jgi:hypothetical protein
MAEKDIRIQLLLNTNEAEKSIGGIKQGLRDLKSAALEAGEGSEEFARITRRAGELQDKLNDVNGSISALAGNTAENLTTSFTRVAQAGIGAFQAIKGAQAVFGVENKNLQEQLVKLQGLINLSSGIKEVANIGQAFKDFRTVIASVIPQLFTYTTAAEGATVAQTGLNTAMRLSPIGILVTAIIAAAGAYALFASDADDAADSQDEINKKLEEGKKKADEINEAYEKLYGPSEKSKAEKRIKEIKEERAEANKQFDDAAIKLEDLRKKLEGFNRLDPASKALVVLGGNIDYEKDINDLLKFQKEKLLIIGQGQKEELVLTNIFFKELNDASQKADEELKKLQEEERKRRLDATKVLIDDSKRLTDAEQIRTARNKEAELEILRDRDNQRIAQEFEASDKSLKAAQARDAALIAIENKFQADLKKVRDDAQAIWNTAYQEILDSEVKDNKASNDKKLKNEEDWLAGLQEILNKESQITEDAARKRAERQQYYQDLILQVNRNLVELNRVAQTNITSVGVSISEGIFKIQEVFIKVLNKDFKTKLDEVNAYAQAIGSTLNNFLEQVVNNNQTALNRDISALNSAAQQEQAILEKKYSDGLITREEYDAANLAATNKQINQENALKKKAFEADKKLRIAQAVISGAQGAIAAFASAQVLPPPAGQIVGAIGAAAVAALTAVNVNRIKATQFEGSPNVSANPAPSTSPSLGSGGISSASNTTPSSVALFGTAGRNQSLGGTTPTLVQAYVLESDITASQRRVRNIKSLSEL